MTDKIELDRQLVEIEMEMESLEAQRRMLLYMRESINEDDNVKF